MIVWIRSLICYSIYIFSAFHSQLNTLWFKTLQMGQRIVHERKWKRGDVSYFHFNAPIWSSNLLDVCRVSMGEFNDWRCKRADYLFSDIIGSTTPFPDNVGSRFNLGFDFAHFNYTVQNGVWSVRCKCESFFNAHYVAGDPNLRTLDASSFAQQAVTFLCLDFSGTSSKFNELPTKRCPSGIRSQIVCLSALDILFHLTLILELP